jgi:hypothetical protein
MDALDEFFREWCEPEAWCEHCGNFPAIHVVIQDDQSAYGSVVTYVRIWDSNTQTHLAVCRTCSTHHIETLDTQTLQYAHQQHESPRRHHRHAGWGLMHRVLRLLQQRIRKLLVSGRRHNQAGEQAETTGYSHTES